jgi:hypothetical protein
MGEPLANGHDKESEATLAEACDLAGGTASAGSIIMQEQLRAVQIGAARHAERATIEALAQDAVRRLADAYKANDWQRAAEITREIVRLELYLSKRGFV